MVVVIQTLRRRVGRGGGGAGRDGPPLADGSRLLGVDARPFPQGARQALRKRMVERQMDRALRNRTANSQSRITDTVNGELE